MGRLIGVAAVGAAAAGALGALPAEAQESRSHARITHRLFPHTNGPRTPASYKGSFLAGVAFEATTGGCWLEGFWWWVCHHHQSTKAQKFALWQAYPGDGDLQGQLIKSATAEARRLHAGRWNFISLHRPVPLAIGATYVAATGLKNDFPITEHSFGKGERYHAGIKSGPLLAYSDISGSHPVPFGGAQALFSVAGDDPTRHMPGLGDGQSSNFWMDLQVTTSSPKGTSYRLWPNFPVIPGAAATLDEFQQSCGTEFWLSERCKLDKIWFYSPPGATVLPNECAIFDVSTQNMVPNTRKASPGWSGKPGIRLGVVLLQRPHAACRKVQDHDLVPGRRPVLLRAGVLLRRQSRHWHAGARFGERHQQRADLLAEPGQGVRRAGERIPVQRAGRHAGAKQQHLPGQRLVEHRDVPVPVLLRQQGQRRGSLGGRRGHPGLLMREVARARECR